MMDDPEDAIPDGVEALLGDIWPLLAGRAPEVAGEALANLLAIWLASHFGPPGFREALLTMHISMVCELIPDAEQMILERLREQAKKGESS
jgi:hypothetical protein